MYTESSLMSSNSLMRALPDEVFFRNANGDRLILEEKANLSSADNIINLSLRSEKYFNVNLCLVLFCATFIVWIVLETLIPLIISVCILILQCKSLIASEKQGNFFFIKWYLLQIYFIRNKIVYMCYFLQVHCWLWNQ